MKARLAASVALALGIALAGTGCSMITYQATTERYDASDGVSADVGDLAIRNILVVSDDGESGNLLMTVVNRGGDDVELSVQYADGGTTEIVPIEGGSTVVFGTGDVETEEQIEPYLLSGIDTDPGSLMPIYLQYGGEPGVQVQAPVLDGGLPEYAEYVP
ncbi:hypothetical protein ARHIZOSPH14_23620 [Agromyces rhizosphaerae]|uniref:DNA modification methylase n=1 Tax=Agromyces rhizosphaerae TaxID=88374 RepID=A0A9W6CXG6_9MICO|nr:hypothetical protein [Agromyces rhizosphaerae]GLI28120.1 hypothetical protein ARHIZOSPH14_23620 [Agromyces rhizosphaerae]